MSNPELIPGTQALSKGIRVLRAIASEGRSARFTQLQARTGFPKPTLHRMLKALVAEGLAQHDPKTGNYRLGLSLLQLAFEAMAQLDVRDAAHEDMLHLSERTGEAVHLAVLDGTAAVYVDLVESRQPVGHIGRLGSMATLHAAASGKVIAAHLNPREQERVLGQLALPRLTPHTVTDPETLRAQFEQIRQQGYALNEEEENEGVSGVAAPIFGLAGAVVGSLGISIPSYRYNPTKLSFYADSAVQAARNVSVKLGYTAPSSRSAPTP